MLTTVESIYRRTEPVTVKWLTATEYQRQFGTVDEALGFARQFNEQQRLSLRIEFATGEAMLYPEIAERLGWA
jgi:hypothetical protein